MYPLFKKRFIWSAVYLGICFVVFFGLYYAGFNGCCEERRQQAVVLGERLREVALNIRNRDQREEAINVGRILVEEELRHRIPRVLDREWWVSIPDWVVEPQSFDEDLQNILEKVQKSNEKAD